MRPLTLKIPAGEVVEVGAVGDYIRIKSALVEITAEAPDNNERAEMEQGDDVVFSPFQRLRFSHADVAEQTVRVYVGKGTRAGSSKIGGSITASVSNLPAQQGAMTQAAATVTNASGQLLAAKANRRVLIVQNNDATGNIFVNLTGVAATVANGIKIAPGGSLILDVYAPSAAITAIGDIASNANVIVIEG